MKEKYVIEVRDTEGRLDFKKEAIKRKEHPYLFSKQEYSIDDLCYYASFGQDRDCPMGPMQLGDFFNSIGISYRKKYW